MKAKLRMQKSRANRKQAIANGTYVITEEQAHAMKARNNLKSRKCYHRGNKDRKKRKWYAYVRIMDLPDEKKEALRQRWRAEGLAERLKNKEKMVDDMDTVPQEADKDDTLVDVTCLSSDGAGGEEEDESVAEVVVETDKVKEKLVIDLCTAPSPVRVSADRQDAIRKKCGSDRTPYRPSEVATIRDSVWNEELLTAREYLADRRFKEPSRPTKLVPNRRRIAPFNYLSDALPGLIKMVRTGTREDSGMRGLLDDKWERAHREVNVAVPSLLHIVRLLDPVVEATAECLKLHLEVAPDDNGEGSMLLTLHDARRGRPGKWMGDGLIDDYVRYLNLVASHVGCNHVVMTVMDALRLQLWDKKEDSPLFSSSVHSFHDVTLSQLCDMFDRVVFPVSTCANKHWSVAVLTKTKKTVAFAWYCSLSKPVDKTFHRGVQCLLKGSRLLLATPRLVQCPLQGDDWNCGAFACWNIEEILVAHKFGDRLVYNGTRVAAYRLLIIYRILGCIRW